MCVCLYKPAGPRIHMNHRYRAWSQTQDRTRTRDGLPTQSVVTLTRKWRMAMLGKAAAGSGRRRRRRGVHKKLNSMKLINALLSFLLLLLLGFKRRLQAGAERETAALLFIYLFSIKRGCFSLQGGALWS